MKRIAKISLKVAAGIFVLLIIAGLFSEEETSKAPVKESTAEVVEVKSEEPKEAKAPTPAPAPKPEVTEPEPTETMSQQQAVRKAESYLSFSAFSRSGLIGQLEYEGFTTADATYAVDTVKVDWKAQAVKKAESYLKFSSFSKSGLIGQLEYEGFSTEDATYAVGEVGL